MNRSVQDIRRSLSSKEIRKIFVDYFVNNHAHKFVRSSPVVPYCDSTLAFVNAGMNQFKSIFLGKTQPQYRRVTNSQKCIRVGGKHNDINIVGQDGYHHTFFEMLGNWSFGDYFKKEACSMALELLQGPLGINMDRLYVTYFAGDDTLNLPVDLEILEIWRSLGFPKSRILPFGSKENFWEMGLTGPCGPCTEIHIDHLGNFSNPNDRAKAVNMNRPDLTELWNIVFIEYNRKENGIITKLPTKHVDTGMGFERLVAVMQNKTSNYETDLFEPIFQAIHKSTKVLPYSGSFSSNDDNLILDTAYRILADHSRMISVCLADGMLPHQNQKLRRVLRKSLLLTEQIFSNENLLNKLVPIIGDILGVAYPEIITKQNSIVEIIDHERELYKALRATACEAFKHVLVEYPNLSDIEVIMECPGFIHAYRDLQTIKSNFQNNTIPGHFLYKLYDTYGLTRDMFSKLADMENMECDWIGYEAAIAEAKQQQQQKLIKGFPSLSEEARIESKIEKAIIDLTETLERTDNHYKYDYYYDDIAKEYNMPLLKTKIIGILYNDVKVNEVIVAGATSTSDIISIVTTSSNFYHESGGQESDKGWLLFEPALMDEASTNRKLKVLNVQYINDCIVHVCKLCNTDNNEYFSFGNGDDVFLKIDSKRRSGNIHHHTAVHLLNAAVRNLYKKVTYQTSSSVNSKSGQLEIGIIGKQLAKNDIVQIENFIGQVIKASIPIEVQVCNASDILHDNDIIMIPGEIYPEHNLRLISIRSDNRNYTILSKELCCGTHALNTQELEHFCITNFKQISPGNYAFTVAAGVTALKMQNVANLLKNQLDIFERSFQCEQFSNAMESELYQIRHNLNHMKIVLPYVFKMDSLERINNILRQLRNIDKSSVKQLIEIEMRNLLMEKPVDIYPYIIHYLTISHVAEDIPLQKATKLCPDRPILIINMNYNIVKARCCVPKKCQKDGFTAQKWLSKVSAVFNAEIAAPRGQNPDEICNMKGKKASPDFNKQLEIALAYAHAYAKKFLL